MAELYGNEDYVQNSIVTSRIIQEDSAVFQGISAYGILASLIDTNIEKIDGMAEYIGLCVAQNHNLKNYYEQYGNDMVDGFVQRNLTKPDSARENQNSRRDKAFWESLVLEAGIKFSARAIGKWATEKDKYRTFQQVYTILYCFANDRTVMEGNKRKTLLELKKIRESFPLSKRNKDKIAQLNIQKDIAEISMDSLTEGNNSNIRDTISYLLYSLYMQKFEAAEGFEPHILEYYNVLGYSDLMAREMLRENANKYSQISYDQTRYLKVARGMVKNFNTSLPNIDTKGLAERAIQMSQYDPYFLPSMRASRMSPAKERKRIADIFFENPEMVTHAGITAVSQLLLDDNSKENVRKKLIEWGIENKASDIILSRSDMIRTGASSF